ncbi:MAG: hypothetical protein H0Z24_05685 [Thermosipho sp. (in: Bacteria)]|nr:hypothetical protein [Thermosipho sp. (in: thermotogales)]
MSEKTKLEKLFDWCGITLEHYHDCDIPDEEMEEIEEALETLNEIEEIIKEYEQVIYELKEALKESTEEIKYHIECLCGILPNYTHTCSRCIQISKNKAVLKMQKILSLNIVLF